MRYRQPQHGPSRINWSNPLTRDLLYASNTAVNPVITGAKVVTPDGIGTGDNTPIYDSGKSVQAGVNYQKGLTVLTIGYLNGTADNGATSFGLRVGPSNNINNTQFAVYLPPFASRANVGVLINYADFSATSQVEVPHGVSVSGGRIAMVGTYVPNDAAGLKVYVNGALKGSTATTSIQPFNGGTNIQLNSADGGNLVTGFPTVANFIWTRALTPDEIKSISDNPWQLFEQPAIRLFAGPLPSSNGWPIGGNVALGTLLYPTGPVTHAATGALVGSASTIAGSAFHSALHATAGALTGGASTTTGAATHNALHTTTGALSGVGATASGAATRFRAFAATGALSGSASTITGSATRTTGVTAVTHDATGALAGSPSTVAGASARFRAFATTGALTGGSSSISGTSTRCRAFSATGALVGQASTVAGSATRFRSFSTTGALTGQASTVTGSAARFRAFATTGALTGQGSTASGSANRYRAFATTGALVGQASQIAGSAARFRAFGATGALVNTGATINGTALRSLGPVSHDTSGSLANPGATVTGAALRFATHSVSGILTGQASTITGSASRSAGAVTHATSGALTGQASTASGTAARFRAFATTGSLLNTGATASGAASRTRVHDATGAASGGGSSVAGSANRFHVFGATGAINGGGASITGVSAKQVLHMATGQLIGAAAVVTGSASHGGGSYSVDATRAALLSHIYLLHGLDAGSPMTVDQTSRKAGGVEQTISGNEQATTVKTTALPDGLTVDPTTAIDALAKLYGLTVDAVTTPSGVVAGAVVQTFDTSGSTVKVTRQ